MSPKRLDSQQADSRSLFPATFPFASTDQGTWGPGKEGRIHRYAGRDVIGLRWSGCVGLVGVSLSGSAFVVIVYWGCRPGGPIQNAGGEFKGVALARGCGWSCWRSCGCMV